jgi:acyl-coenzyme A synthetase/AMP-(fatty) acid ligase
MPPLPNNFAYSMGAAIKIITDSGSSICLASNLVLKMIKMQLLLRHRKLNQRLPKDFEWIDYSNAVGHKDENFTEPEISPESTLMLQYSSGSTGDPKGIILTHEVRTENISLFGDLINNTFRTFSTIAPKFSISLVQSLLPAASGNSMLQIS